MVVTVLERLAMLPQRAHSTATAFVHCDVQKTAHVSDWLFLKAQRLFFFIVTGGCSLVLLIT